MPSYALVTGPSHDPDAGALVEERADPILQLLEDVGDGEMVAATFFAARTRIDQELAPPSSRSGSNPHLPPYVDPAIKQQEDAARAKLAIGNSKPPQTSGRAYGAKASWLGSVTPSRRRSSQRTFGSERRARW